MNTEVSPTRTAWSWLLTTAAMALPMGLGLAWGGLVVYLLWAWLITPVFGVPALRFLHAMAISLVLGYVKYQPSHETTKDMDVFGRKVANALFTSAIFLATAWVLHWYL